MANSYNALMEMRLVADETVDPTADPGAVGTQTVEVGLGAGGVRWTNGTGNGKIGRSYKRIRTVGSGATDSYDVLAAGSLLTPGGVAIDLDELKGLMLRVTSGQIKLVATASNGLDCFTDADAGVHLKASGGMQAISLYFGKDGLDVTTNSKFAIIETSASASATYQLSFIGAE